MRFTRRASITVVLGASLAVTLLPAAFPPAFPQQSASYQIKSWVLNSGGSPLAGAAPASPSYLLRPGALGEAASSTGMTSASYSLSAGFVLSFPPPAEVSDLILPDIATLAWQPVGLAGHYHLYRSGPIGSATGTVPPGQCLQPDVSDTMTTDQDVPPPDLAFFYFVTAVNCIGIEGPGGPIAAACP